MADSGIQGASQHEVVVPSNAVISPGYRAVYAQQDSDVTVVMLDDSGAEVAITYPMLSGAYLPIRPHKITAATGTVIGWR